MADNRNSLISLHICKNHYCTVIDDYVKDGGPEAVRPLCSFYHDPLPYYLVKYEAHICKLSSSSFSKTVYLISKQYDLK